MSANRDHLSRKDTTRRGKSGNVEATHVWARTDESGVSRGQRKGMRSGLEGLEGAALADGGGFSNVPPVASAGYASSGPSPAARAMFGGAADNLSDRPVPAAFAGAQKWSVVVAPASRSRAMAALDDFRHVGTPFPAGTVGRAFAAVS